MEESTVPPRISAYREGFNTYKPESAGRNPFLKDSIEYQAWQAGNYKAAELAAENLKQH